ncbi:MAG: malonyl-[acyl-carrier protein] O-methyltransferase BioC [Pseudomonadota bacterium]|jgi:malonyl-CoA O-methyltransferase
MSDADYTLQQRDIARSFGRASASYDAAARLQATVRGELLSRLDGLTIEPQVVLDLGAGTGLGTEPLKRRYRKAQVVAMDLAEGMLREARRHSRFWRPIRCVAGDAARLPLRDASVDLVFSSLMLQWCEPLDTALAEISRVLKPGGLLLFSSFGPDTLRELRSAWASVDDAVHVNVFVDMHDLGSALQRGGYGEPVLDVDRHVLHYAEAMALMRELKAIGAHNVNAGRARALTGRGALQRMIGAYELLRQPQGLPATYEVVFGAAWAPQAMARPLPVAAETRLSPDRLLQSLRKPRP